MYKHVVRECSVPQLCRSCVVGVSCQTSSRVTSDSLLLQLHTYQTLTLSALAQAQDLVKVGSLSVYLVSVDSL